MRHQLFCLSPYVYVRNNPLNRFDPNGYVDWLKVGFGALGVAGGIVETVSGGVIAAGTGVTVVGAAGGAALMVHGLSTTGFGVATMIAGFKDDGSTVPSGPLQAIGEGVSEATGNELFEKAGALGDAAVGVASGGNPLKNLKNVGNALPVSAKQAKNMPGYQKEVAKELIQATTTVTSEVQAVDATHDIVKEVIKKEEDIQEQN